MKTTISRRELIQKSLASFGALSLPISLTACGNDDSETVDSPRVEFLHGVASGDPLLDRVILWTRLTPQDTLLRYEVVWEISSDQAFTSITNTGKVQTSAASDFTIKVDAGGLKSATIYFYRFKYGSLISSIGQTKTLATQVDSVQFAVCSCANYPAGFFHVYKEIAQQNVDVVIHLGDYIYEYGMGEYGTQDAEQLGRGLAQDNNQEIISLDDYRKRYSWYRQDQDMQAVHQRHPFIVVWDDHEVANNTWEEGAENHQEDEGDFLSRKLAALQAYFEWMPIRPLSETDHLNIYRQFNFGELVQLNMLDTRILARNKQLDYADYLTAQGLDAAKFQADLFDPRRTMIGSTQLAWLKQKLSESTAKWNVLGQQILMTKMLIPAEILQVLTQVVSGNVDAAVMQRINQLLRDLVTIKMRYQQKDPTLTAQEISRITTVVPYNLDAWDGYMVERETLYSYAQQFNKKLVVIAGDTHNAWQSTLKDQKGNMVGVELATSSVTSPGMELYLQIPLEQAEQFESAFAALIDELEYTNLTQRGYLKVSFTATEMKSEWIFIDTIKNAQYQLDEARKHTASFDINLQPIVAIQKIA